MRVDEVVVASCAVGVWLCVVALLVEELRSRATRRREERERRWLGHTLRHLWAEWMQGEGMLQPLPMPRCALRRSRLAVLLARMTAATYGLYGAPMRRLVECYGVDVWLLQRACRTRGWRRAHYLKLLSELPHRRAYTLRALRFLDDPCREVRFAALLVQLAADPEQLLRRVADYAHPFTAVETAEVLHLLRSGLLPIAYGPLLASQTENLCRVGMALVAQFEIAEAEPLLRGLVVEGDRSLARRAIYVLAMMHRPLSRREVRGKVRAMSADERARLLRFLAHEGYSAEQVRRLCDEEEWATYKRRVESYKCSLMRREG